MANIDPVTAGYTLLWTTLTADSALMALISGVYQVMAPPQSSPDYALIIHQSGQDTNSATAVRILSHLLFQVKIVGPATDSANIHAAFARADALLQPSGQPVRNAGGTLALYRQQTFSLGELVNGALWLNHGGIYAIEV